MQKVNSRLQISSILLTLILTSLMSTAYGSGFAVLEQSASSLGSAMAGATADADDPSCIFFNPALMTDLGPAPQASVGLHAIIPSFSFSDEGSGYPALGNMPLTGDNGGEGGENAYVPNLYYAQGIAENVSLGIGVFAPWGLATSYDSGWKGRYHALDTDMTTVNINPSVAWKLNDYLSIGAGLSAQYIHAELSSAVDFGSILAAHGAPGAMPQMLDGKATIKGDDWGYGYNAGLTMRPTDTTQLGLSYRSQIESTLDGDADFDVPAEAAGLQAQNTFVNTDAKADITLPETVTLGIAQKLGEKLTILSDICWTRWSRFDELRVKYDSNQPDSVTEEKWEDTWRLALGAKYALDEQWTLRIGAAYDPTPIPSQNYRTPRIPDADRTWLSLGTGFQATENLSFDAGYIHIFFNTSSLKQVGSTGDVLQGEYNDGYVNIFSLQMNYLF
ncbi:MAG: transporter [Spartobacteria bacterium]|nr:transporter [Spartobacteria bacterium]